jgi:hypothetical protein
MEYKHAVKLIVWSDGFTEEITGSLFSRTILSIMEMIAAAVMTALYYVHFVELNTLLPVDSIWMKIVHPIFHFFKLFINHNK